MDTIGRVSSNIQLSGGEEIHRLNCIRIYKDFIQRYTDWIGAIQLHESECGGKICSCSTDDLSVQKCV